MSLRFLSSVRRSPAARQPPGLLCGYFRALFPTPTARGPLGFGLIERHCDQLGKAPGRSKTSISQESPLCFVRRLRLRSFRYYALIEQLMSGGGARFTDFVNFLLRLILQLVELLYGQKVLGRQHAKLFEPFGVDVQTPRRLPDGLAENLLPFFAEQPVDENFSGVGVRRVFDDGQISASPAGI